MLQAIIDHFIPSAAVNILPSSESIATSNKERTNSQRYTAIESANWLTKASEQTKSTQRSPRSSPLSKDCTKDSANFPRTTSRGISTSSTPAYRTPPPWPNGPLNKHSTKRALLQPAPESTAVEGVPDGPEAELLTMQHSTLARGPSAAPKSMLYLRILSVLYTA
jgi:hypothetical protein